MLAHPSAHCLGRGRTDGVRLGRCTLQAAHSSRGSTRPTRAWLSASSGEAGRDGVA